MVSFYKHFSAYPLSNNVLRVGVAVYPLMRPECINRPGAECEAGLELEILTAVTNMLNFTLVFKYSNQVGCGYKANGSWTGLLGMLQRKEIDVIGNLCGLDPSRMFVPWLQYSWPIIVYKQNFLIKAPEPKYNFNVAGPFHWQVWLALLICSILFLCTFLVHYRILAGHGFRNSIKRAMLDTLDIISGSDVRLFKMVWFLFVCFIGFMMVMYSTLIAAALIKPVTVERPFSNSSELVKALYNGEYKILDFVNPPYVKCVDNATCDMLKSSIKLHGVQLFTNPKQTNGPSLLLNELLANPKLVLIKGRFMLRQYLDTYTERSRLWLIDDDSSSEDWSVFFFRKDFAHQREFDKALVRMGDAKDNLKVLYYGLSYQVIQTKIIKGKIPDKITIDVHLLTGPTICYSIGLFVAVIFFTFELLSIKMKC